MSKNDPFEQIYQRVKSEKKEEINSLDKLEALNKQRLKALYIVSQQLNTILKPDKLFKEVVNKIVDLVNAEHVVIVLKGEDGLKIQNSHNIDDQSEQNALQFSRSIVSEVIDAYQPLFSTNALEDNRFSQHQTIQDLEILSFICVPIRVEKAVLGTIYVDNRHLTNVFTDSDVEFLQAFANLLGIAIRNSLAYQEIEELNRSLEEKVEKRTTKLKQTIKQLKTTQQQLIQSEKMASLGRLIAGFVHEFNNPINFIYSNLPHLESYHNQLLNAVDTLLSQLPKEERENIENEYDLNYLKSDLIKLTEGIREGAYRSREISDNLKNFSGKKEKTFQKINWNENLKTVLEMFKKQSLTNPKIEISFEKNFFVYGNKTELNQSMLNLLNNAADAGATQINISCTEQNGQLRCEIQDNGYGISKKDQQNIFEPFYTTKEVGQGLGLGLSIVYGVILHHGGHIEVDSESGQGTTFSIVLPQYS